MTRGRRKTIPEAKWPDTPDFVELAQKWRSDAITVLLNFVWQGYDLYQQNVLSTIDLSHADEQLERSITQDLAIDIHNVMSGFEPFVIQPERFEMEQREPPPARPKQYDLAFVWTENRRIVWPLEAKILHSDSSVSEYIKEITDNYLVCRYSPFSSEAGMLAYLLKGSPKKAFGNIARFVPCQLVDHVDFQSRDHKTSDHQRLVPAGESYPSNFRCHHLILNILKGQSTEKATARKTSTKQLTKRNSRTKKSHDNDQEWL